MNKVSAPSQPATLVCTDTVQVRVAWQKRISKGWSAIAEESVAGFAKGEVVLEVPSNLKSLPPVLHMFPKNFTL